MERNVMNSKRIFYVDSINGDDAREGLAPETAWKSLERVNEQEFQPGDALYLKRGCCWHGMLRPKGSGSGESPIMLGAYGNDEMERPVIHGDGAFAAVWLEGVSFWQIRNIVMYSAWNLHQWKAGRDHTGNRG